LSQQSAAAAVHAAFERRVGPGRALAAEADTIARACHAMAMRFSRGGRLIVFGNGGSSADAQHVAVEFVHPVIVGKAALPAISLTNDGSMLTAIARTEGFDEVFATQVRLFARPWDIALGCSVDGRCANVLRGLRAARDAGLLTVALVGGDGGEIARSSAADYVLSAPCRDPRVVKELHVTIYHILWELVHVFFDQPDLLEEVPVTRRRPSPPLFESDCEPQAGCHGTVCVTCSDAAVPVRVLRLLGDGLALVETEAGPEEVSVALVEAEPGDVVLVHAKEAIAVQRSSP
jgi:D-sedoheptulose 7-phosphate isomerase